MKFIVSKMLEMGIGHVNAVTLHDVCLHVGISSVFIRTYFYISLRTSYTSTIAGHM